MHPSAAIRSKGFPKTPCWQDDHDPFRSDIAYIPYLRAISCTCWKNILLQGSKSLSDNVLGSVMPPAAQYRPTFDAGSIWLVGTRSGELGLLTLHAVPALQQAEITFGGSPPSGEIPSLATRARRAAVDQWPDGTRTAQQQINQQDATRPEQAVQITTLAAGTDQPVAISPMRIVPGLVVTERNELVERQQTMPRTADQQQGRIAG
jgi:hypothetical protein